MTCLSVNNTHRRVMLSFHRTKLDYDIGNYSFVEGDIMKTDDEHDRHQVMDVTEEGNADRVTRVLNIAHAECVEMLYPFTKKPVVDGTELDNTLTAPETYVIELMLPDKVAQSSVEMLNHLIHEYLVCSVMQDWMSITNPASKANWEEKLEKMRDRIKTTIMWRTKRLRRTQTPF